MSSKNCKPTSSPKKKGRTYSKSFKHWITGVVYFAEDYGYEAWPIGKR